MSISHNPKSKRRKMGKNETEIMRQVDSGSFYCFVVVPHICGERRLKIAERLQAEGKIELRRVHKSPSGYVHYECHPVKPVDVLVDSSGKVKAADGSKLPDGESRINIVGTFEGGAS